MKLADVSSAMIEAGLYAAYRANLDNVRAEFDVVAGYTDNSKLKEPRAHVTVAYCPDPFSLSRYAATVRVLFRELPTVTATVESVEIFDGSDEATKTIVLALDSPELIELHKVLTELGVRYSHPVYRPHLSLGYNLSVTQCAEVKEKLTSAIGKTVDLNSPYVEALVE